MAEIASTSRIAPRPTQTWRLTALGAGAHKLAPVLARPAAWRILDGLIAVVMVGVAVGLLV